MQLAYRESFDLFLESKVLAWRKWRDEPNSTACSLVSYLGMSYQEYGNWFLGRLDDLSYDRLNRVWGDPLVYRPREGS